MVVNDDVNIQNTADATKQVLNALKSSVECGKLTEDTASNIQHVLENKNIQNLLMIHTILARKEKPIQKRDYIELCVDIMAELESFKDESEQCRKLLKIMNDPYFRCLIETHDNILYETYKPTDDSFQISDDDNGTAAVRVVGLTKSPKEPLGITFGKHRDKCIYVRRLLRGTMVEKQGLVNVGDVVREINGQPVGKNVDEAQKRLNNCGESITMKILPAMNTAPRPCQIYFRCHFDYNPENDPDFPKHDVGLSFKRGDIINVIDQSDADWWQASHVEDESTIGIIPSTRFQQMRKTSNLPEQRQTKVLGLFSKSKKKIIYNVSKNSMFDCLDIPLYEEVTRMPPIERKLILLVGASGVGRRTIINQLILKYPDRYASAVSDTSRQPRDGEKQGEGYNFLEREKMQHDISMGSYLEWGEHNGHFYGKKIDTVRDVINAGKICVLDCEPSALKLLKTAEFMPVIVFIESPKIDILIRMNQEGENNTMKRSMDQLNETIRENNEIKEIYCHYFDFTMCNEKLEETISNLLQQLNDLSSNSQWVPISWVY